MRLIDESQIKKWIEDLKRYNYKAFIPFRNRRRARLINKVKIEAYENILSLLEN